MKVKNIAVACLLTLASAAASLSYALTAEQRDELYRRGTITVFDNNGLKQGHYEVKFMPGSENVTADMNERLKKAESLMGDLVDKDGFWRAQVGESFFYGLDIVRKGVYEQGVCATPQDFRETCEKNRQISGNFGARAGQAKNWIGFSFLTLGRCVTSVLGFVGGVSYALVVPTAKIIAKPVGAAYEAGVRGMIWGGLKYTWNGTAWVLVKNNQQPKQGDMTVKFVPTESSVQ